MSGNDYRNLCIFYGGCAATLAVAIGFAGVGINKGIKYLKGIDSSHTIPRDVKVKEGFVKPSKIEIILKDIDKDGKNETIMRYNNVEYLLTTDTTGKPILNQYSVEPMKIVKY